MAKRLQATSALAAVLILVSACGSSSSSPSAAASAAAPSAAAPSAAAPRAAAPSASAAAAPSAAPVAAVPTVPTGYTELDTALTKGADGKLPYAGQTASIQTRWIGGEGTNFAASVADFATATGIKVQIDSIGSSHQNRPKNRVRGGQPPHP